MKNRKRNAAAVAVVLSLALSGVGSGAALADPSSSTTTTSSTSSPESGEYASVNIIGPVEKDKDKLREALPGVKIYTKTTDLKSTMSLLNEQSDSALPDNVIAVAGDKDDISGDDKAAGEFLSRLNDWAHQKSKNFVLMVPETAPVLKTLLGVDRSKLTNVFVIKFKSDEFVDKAKDVSQKLVKTTPGKARTTSTSKSQAPSTSSSVAPTSEASATTAAPESTDAGDESTPADDTTAVSSTPASGSTTAAQAGAGSGCNIALDPGHSTQTIDDTDQKTGIVMKDYSNNYEDKDVFAVAEAVKKNLESKGYKVTLVKASVDERVNYRQRVDRATAAHANLGVSIHTNHGAGTSEVYPQGVGTSRDTAPGSGKKVTMSDADLGKKSMTAAQAVSKARSAVEGGTVKVNNPDFNNREGLAAGDITNIQLIAANEKLVWVYNEYGSAAGGGGVGNISADEKSKYVEGLTNGIAAASPCKAS